MSARPFKASGATDPAGGPPPVTAPTRGRLRGAVAVTALAALVAGCTSSAGDAAEEPSDAASSTTEPLVLRIATNEGPDTRSGATILHFARTVDDLSAGELRIEPVWEAAGTSPGHWDQAVARTVMDGDNELGYIPTRAFDVLGVTTLQPLQIPFLLTSSARVEAVVGSNVADDLMLGLDAVGLTGLGLFSEDLRRLFSYGEPMTGPDQLSGVTIRAAHSDMTAAVFASFDAEVDDPSGEEWTGAVAAGRVAGTESSLAFMGMLGADHPATTVPGNQVLFPKVNVLVVNREAFERLDGRQRALLRDAAVATRDAPGLRASEAEARDVYCAAGGRVVTAPAADLAAFRDAAAASFAPPHEREGTGDLVEAVEDLVRDLPADEVVEPCRRTGGAGTSGAPPGPAIGDALLVVDTQIGSSSASPVVGAASGFRGCRTVRDLTADVDETDPDVTRFTGTKLVSCAGGKVTLTYEASMEAAAPGTTSGTWRIIDSTLAAVRSGRGRLAGDGAACDTAADADGCIRDIYTGTVRR